MDRHVTMLGEAMQIGLPTWFEGGKPVKVEEASPDAEYVLQPHEFRYEWRLCTVPVAALKLGSDWHVAGETAEREEARYAEIEQWMRGHGDAMAALQESPLLLALLGGGVYVLDGFHRAMLAAHKFHLTELPAVVGKPRRRVRQKDNL